MAELKLNFVLWDVGIPGLRYDAAAARFVPPSDTQMALLRAQMAYFRARHIAVCLVLGAKWDARTLEGKRVSDEPFRFAGNGTAVASGTPFDGEPLNGDFEQLRADA